MFPRTLQDVVKVEKRSSVDQGRDQRSFWKQGAPVSLNVPAPSYRHKHLAVRVFFPPLFFFSSLSLRCTNANVCLHEKLMHLHIQDIALCSMIVVHSGICKHTHTSNLAHVLREESIKYLQSTWWLRSLYKVHEDKRDHLCLIETLLHFLSPNSPRRPHLTGSICTLHWQVPATLGRACCVAATPPLVVVVAFKQKCRLDF